MADYLEKLNERDVAAFYRRLALATRAKSGGDSLAASFLLHWLDGQGKPKVYPAKYVRYLEEVRSYLRDTARPIFLSRRPAPDGVIKGIVPRLKGKIKSSPLGGSYKMHLEGNVETPLLIEAKAVAGMMVEPRELDALYALHGFMLISDVVASAAKTDRKTMYEVKFESWVCKASDEYHWNPDKHISVPNPDHGSKEKGAVAPGDSNITIYHKNAIRVEKAGLAKPYHNESEPWNETDLSVTGPATVTI